MPRLAFGAAKVVKIHSPPPPDDRFAIAMGEIGRLAPSLRIGKPRSADWYMVTRSPAHPFGRRTLERVHHAFAHEGASVMLFNGIVYPEELTALCSALDDYCVMAGIDQGSQQHLQTARIAMRLFGHGLSTREELRAALLQRLPSSLPYERSGYGRGGGRPVRLQPNHV